MDFLDDPEEMTPEQRLREVAAILLAGYHALTEKRLDGLASDRPLCGDEPTEVSR